MPARFSTGLTAIVMPILLGASAVAASGCGPGISVRSHGTVPIRSTGSGSGAAESPLPSGAPSGAPSSATGTAETADHEDELPQLPAAVSVDDEPEQDAPPMSLAGGAPAMRYASLDRITCEAELGRRHIAFERVGEARGVIAPLRLKGPIAGVDFHSMLPLAQRRTSPYEIYDCRLVLALDDWARVLARYDVVEVVHYPVYRPPPAKQVLNGAGRRHSGALAIDAAIFKTRDGQTISVEKDFHGRIGSKPCGAKAASTVGLPASAVTLRKIVCEAADAQMFNVMLTPDYNWPHRNHFHLEVTAGARWVLVR
jgi:hypothetical protein